MIMKIQLIRLGTCSHYYQIFQLISHIHIFGLISGNSNIVKVPSKQFEEIDLICKSINKVLRKKNFQKLNK